MKKPDLPNLISTEKSLAYFPGWTDSAAEEETGYLFFDAPLEIYGVVEQSFVLHGGCYKDKPDRHVAFELKFHYPGSSRKIPLFRVEWRNPRGHTNQRKGNSKWRGKKVASSHIHDFHLNYLPDYGRMRGGDLPIARNFEPPEQEPQTFEELRSFIGKLFGINNIEFVESPKWEYNLFYDR